MPDRVFVDTNIWLYSLVQDATSAGDERHRQAFTFLENLASPVLNSQVMRETCSNLIKKSGFPRTVSNASSGRGTRNAKFTPPTPTNIFWRRT
jgi:predicted nucleic acid-binding protein